MAKPNYSFEKRQRELAKKKQQDEKDAKKRAARESAATTQAPDPSTATEAKAKAEDIPASPGRT